jgi:hypothetical protein
MSKTKGQTFRHRFGNETKTFWYRSRICLVENRLFPFGQEYALLDQIEMFSFDGANWGTNSDVMVSFLLDVGTFEERLWTRLALSSRSSKVRDERQTEPAVIYSSCKKAQMTNTYGNVPVPAGDSSRGGTEGEQSPETSCRCDSRELFSLTGAKYVNSLYM